MGLAAEYTREPTEPAPWDRAKMFTGQEYDVMAMFSGSSGERSYYYNLHGTNLK